jgi:hypothetical protein
MLYLTRRAAERPDFPILVLSIDFQWYITGIRGSAGLRTAHSPCTIEAFAVCMLVTGWIERLPEPVPSFAGTAGLEENGQQPWQ